jgi:uncharacterized membrane protein
MFTECSLGWEREHTDVEGESVLPIRYSIEALIILIMIMIMIIIIMIIIIINMLMPVKQISVTHLRVLMALIDCGILAQSKRVSIEFR